MKQLLQLILVLHFTSFTLSAKETPYLAESTSGVIQELSKKEHEKPFKDWLKMHRPAQIEKLFGEKKDEPKPKKDGGDLFSALAELSSAIVDPQVALLDYYINQKAAAGWEVVSLSDNVILFRRVTK